MEAGTQTKQLWMCTSCGFIYDPDDGDPDGGIPPGTPFEQIPDEDWMRFFETNTLTPFAAYCAAAGTACFLYFVL